MQTAILANSVDFSNGEDYYENEYPIQLFSAGVLHLPESFYGTWYMDHNNFMSSDKMDHLTIHYTDDGYFHLSVNGSRYCYSFDSNFLLLANDGVGAKYFDSGISDATLTVYPESPYRLVLDEDDGYYNGTYLEQ